MNVLNLHLFIPELLSVVFLAYFVLESVIAGRKDRPLLFSELAAGSVLLLITLLFFGNNFGSGLNGMMASTPLGFYFKIFFTAVFFVVVFMCREYLKDSSVNKQGFGLVLWSSLTGLLFLSSAEHLLVLFIAIEILTMSLYVLATYGRLSGETENSWSSQAIEAGLKYLTLGSVASAFMVFGIALIYFQTGSLWLQSITTHATLWTTPIGLLGALFFFAGIGFKIAAFPFQLWVPDVYQGSPSPVSAFLSVASKAAGILILIRFLGPVVAENLNGKWQMAFVVMALLTLFYGSLGALAQTSTKRLLGYSSIAHAGYLLIAFSAGNLHSTTAILYYLVAYAASTLAIFYGITLIEKQYGSDHSENFEGLSQTSPLLAWSLFIAILSLAGIPPLAGFMGKFWILFSALQGGQSLAVGLSLIAVVLGIYYYLSLASKMILKEPKNTQTFDLPVSAKLILISLSILSILIGIFQAPLIKAATWALS